MTETTLAKKYQKWEHMNVDDGEVVEKKEDPLIAARRQLETDVALPPEELVHHSPAKKPEHVEPEAEGHQEETKSSKATLVEEMDEVDLGERGLEVPATNYTKALEIFMQRDGESFLSRWNQMAPQMRMNVVDVTFDAMLNHIIAQPTGFRLTREDYFQLCPEIAPDARKAMARDADEFPKLVRKTIKTTKPIAMERLRRRRAELQNITLEIGRSLQYQIVIGDEEAEGSLEIFSSVYRLLVAETLVCVFEALVGRKAADMPHMKLDADEDDDSGAKSNGAAAASTKNIEDELD